MIAWAAAGEWPQRPPRGDAIGPAPASGVFGPILVVDDDASIVEIVGEILAAEGYAVVTAADGNEALRALDRTRPSLVLLDMRMPGLDGWGFARALAARGGDRPPIVVMTAAENAARWAKEIAADGHLAKPFEIAQLLATVERHQKGRAP